MGSALFQGTALAVLAALAFGITTPIVELAGRGIGPLVTAALLYSGAAASALILGALTAATGAPLRRSHLGRLLLVALLGAAVAPALLAWGLQRSGGTIGSLLLNLEAVFTVLLASAFYREPIGRRVATAVVLMGMAGALLVADGNRGGGWAAAGVVAIGGATLAWALDNTLTRGLAELDPTRVVGAKASLGALLTWTLALFVRHEHLPAPGAAAVLLLCGATGYGLSLRLYLLAQRRIGAGRTGSVFAFAPFVGAALAWILGSRAAGPLAAASAALFGTGVYLHLTERHGHRHRHEALEHEHPHRHDDGHHTHVHDPPIAGEHTHPHHHDALDHDHEHAPDIHHGHGHDTSSGHAPGQ